ncbi:precorrin-3B synthase [Paracoccus jiaweipingae]|uniref:precorrin-3B synthase n=1 Tax=Paracoccus sp. p2-l61 TaxID=3366950 RepID=UPI0037A9A3BC
MSRDPIIRGWCPGALRPMMSGDGLVVRVRTRNGYLDNEDARAIAALARRFGNGAIEVTTRANLQLRGVTPRTHPPLIRALRAMGLIDADPEAEARRNVILSPFAAKGGAAWQIATRLAALMVAPDAPQVPAKFGFAVDTGTVLRDTPCDIRLIPTPQGWRLAPDGSPGTLPTGDDPAQAAVDLARWFLASGGAPDGRGRMRAHLEGGASLPRPAQVIAWPPAPRPRPGAAPNGWLTGLPFGRIDPDQMTLLAGLGPLRLTPWHMLLVEGLTRAPQVAGLIDDPADPLLRVHACTGAPDCPQAHAETRNLARRLAPQLAPGHSLHISGCAKGCAHRGPADITLVAQPGGRFDRVTGGTVQDRPTHTGLIAECIRL